MIINLTNNELHYELLKSEYFFENDNIIMISDVNYDVNKLYLDVQKKIIASPDYSTIKKFVNGGFFIVIINKLDKTINIYRDVSGIKTGYYCIKNNSFLIGNNVHEIAKKSNVFEFNEIITDMLLMMGFIPDGKTIYKGVEEFQMGSFYSFNFNGILLTIARFGVNLAKQENNLSTIENVSKLRKQITSTTEKLISSNNIVYLSGGLDSCVMMAAIDDIVPKSNIHSISFKVKGTNQDETKYAKCFANFLNISIDIFEIDPNNKSIFEDFEDKILSSNNPYLGYWIFNPPYKNLDVTYFAGQDTRLHTPSINQFDKLVFNYYSKNKKKWFSDKITKGINNIYTDFYFKVKANNSSIKPIKVSDRVLCSLDFEKYIERYFFKLYPEKIYHEVNLLRNFNEIKKYYNADSIVAINSRSLYNQIVEIKWKEQYTDDIKYIQDMARINNTIIQLPFYDIDLARFSSSIPFEASTSFSKGNSEYSNKKVRVNKMLLREAFKDKLNPEVFGRKKAVSTTNHLLFNGALGKLVKNIINSDINKSHDFSFIKRHGYDYLIKDFISRQSFKQNEESSLLRIYYLATLCIYNKNLLK